MRLSDTGELYWTERRGDELIRYDKEPGTSFWLRADGLVRVAPAHRLAAVVRGTRTSRKTRAGAQRSRRGWQNAARKIQTNTPVNQQIRILGIAGSLRRDSYNRAALRARSSLVPEGATLEIFELDGIPGFNEDEERILRQSCTS